MYRSYVSSVKAVSFMDKSEVGAIICQIAAPYGRHSLIFEKEIGYSFNFSETLQCKVTANDFCALFCAYYRKPWQCFPLLSGFNVVDHGLPASFLLVPGIF